MATRGVEQLCRSRSLEQPPDVRMAPIAAVLSLSVSRLSPAATCHSGANSDYGSTCSAPIECQFRFEEFAFDESVFSSFTRSRCRIADGCRSDALEVSPRRPSRKNATFSMLVRVLPVSLEVARAGLISPKRRCRPVNAKKNSSCRFVWSEGQEISSASLSHPPVSTFGIRSRSRMFVWYNE